MLREVGCRLPAQSALARRQPQRRGHRRPARAAQSARLRTRQPTCQLGHIIGAQAQSARLRTRQRWAAAVPTPRLQHNPRSCAHGNRTSPANPLLCTSTIREFVRTATYVPARPRHLRSSTIHSLARAATAPVPPIRRLPSAQSAHLRAQQPTCQLGHVIGVQAQSTLLRAATVPVPPIRCLASAQSARMRAQQRGQLVGSASGDAVRPAHLHARQQPTTSPQTLSRRASGCPQHSSPATPTRLVHEDALCFLARLEKRIFSLGAGDKHGRDSQAD